MVATKMIKKGDRVMIRTYARFYYKVVDVQPWVNPRDGTDRRQELALKRVSPTGQPVGMEVRLLVLRVKNGIITGGLSSGRKVEVVSR